MNNKRVVSPEFVDDLMNGKLSPILSRVKEDDTLMLALRDSYINIYYRGGSILKIKQSSGNYTSSFDEKYNKGSENHQLREFPFTINSKEDAQTLAADIPALKYAMDRYFTEHGKSEREFQQLVVRENNNSTISNESEYFITDIEFADSGLSARFDILAIRWLATERKNGSNCQAALIEMKYGDGALDGPAGLLKHLQDIEALISKENYSDLLNTMEAQFNQLDKLGLLKFNRSSKGTKVKLDQTDKPEVIFLLANHNPRSTTLNTILNNSEMDKYINPEHFDLKFFVSSFAGYGLHADNMVDLTEFRKLFGNYDKKNSN